MFDYRSNPAEVEEGATRQRLLEAAGEVFAARGYQDATVREICSAAGVNVASVNYHFGDKAGLYKSVLRFADRCAASVSSDSAAVEAMQVLQPEDRLRLFVRGYIACLTDGGRPSWHTKLIAREMAEPSSMLDEIIDENIRPRSEMLTAIVKELLGPEAGPGLLAKCKLSIIGQCLIYHTGRPVIERLHPELSMEKLGLERVADHIVAFSLEAIAGLRRNAAAAHSKHKEASA